MPALAVIGEGLAELSFDAPTGAALHWAPGGDAANVAVMAARLGATVRLGGRVGDDPFGARLLAHWAAEGIDTRCVRRDPGAATGVYLNAPDGDGHRFTYWRTGSAGSRLAPGDLDDAFFADVGVLALTGVTLAVVPAAAAEVAARARAAGARIACVLNHRPALGGDVRALAASAAGADIVIGSQEDVGAVFGVTGAEQLAPLLAGVAELIVTDGAGPVTAVVGGGTLARAVPRVPALDAACAGDAFAGGYLARRLDGLAPDAAIAWAIAAAARSVTRRGCAHSYPDRAETAALAAELERTG